MKSSTFGYTPQQKGSWVPSGYFPVPDPNVQLRLRPNPLRLPQGPNNYPYTNSSNYNMGQCSTNVACGGAYNTNPLSPGLKEVLACYNPGSTILCMEPRKEVQKRFKWFNLTTLVIIILLILVGLVIIGTCMYLGVELQVRRKIMYSKDDDEEAAVEVVPE